MSCLNCCDNSCFFEAISNNYLTFDGFNVYKM